MGTSTDAILAFGWAWDTEDADLGLDEDVEWPELVLKKRGIVNPWDLYPETISREEGQNWLAQNRDAVDAWYAQQIAVRDEFGCDVASHCSGDCPMPYVYVVESEITAWRGTVKQIPLPLAPRASWKSQLERFVGELGIEVDSDPYYFLVSYWSY